MGRLNWSSVSPDKKVKRDDSHMFKLTKDEHILRIVPFPLNSKLFNSEHLNESNNLFVNLVSHNNDVIPFFDNKMTLANETFEEYSDPICKFSRQLSYDNKFENSAEEKAKLKLAKGMMPDRATYCCVIDREDETATPYLWKIPNFKKVLPLFERASAKLTKKLKIADDDDDFFEFDIENGFDMTVESVNEEINIGGRVNKYRAVSTIAFDTDTSPVAETKEELRAIYSSMVNPFSLFHIKTNDELKAILDKKMNGDDDDDDADESAPEGKTISSKSKPFVKKKASLSEDDDDDEDEEELPPSKKAETTSKKNQKDFNELFKAKAKKRAKNDDEDEDEE